MKIKSLIVLAIILVMVFSLSLAALAECACTLAVTSIVPDKGMNNQTVSVKITGKGFQQGAIAKLTRANGSEIVGTGPDVKSATEMTCVFNLNGKALGKWDVTVINPSRNSASLVNGFTIIEAPPPPPPPPPPPAPKLFLKSVFFDLDKFNIRNDQLPAMEEDLKYLKENAWTFLVIKGHADSRGSQEYNIELSRKRGETIKQYLVDKGLPAEKIYVYPYGEDFPSKPGEGEESWSFNRRVDISVWDHVPDKIEALKKEN